MPERLDRTVVPYFRPRAVERVGKEAFRVLRNNSTTTVVVFPRRWGSSEAIGSLAVLGGFLSIFAVLAHSVAQPGAPAARALGLCFLLGFLFVVVIGAFIAGVMFEWAFTQVEFNVGPEGLLFIASWRFGVRQRRWTRDEIADFRVLPHRHPATSDLVVVPVQGNGQQILMASTAVVREVERALREALCMAPAVASAAASTTPVRPPASLPTR